MKKFHVRGPNIYTEEKKKIHLVILEFWNLVWKITKFWKIQIFKPNSVLNYFKIRKFHMNKQDLNAKKLFSAILEFLIKEGERKKKFLNFKKF